MTATAYRAGLAPTPGTVIIPAGPGRVRLRVRDWLGTVGDHATRLTATRLDTGAPALVVAERTAVWEADQRGGASTPGASTLATTWHLAEGNRGAFDSYYAVVNPQATAQSRPGGSAPGRMWISAIPTRASGASWGTRSRC